MALTVNPIVQLRALTTLGLTLQLAPARERARGRAEAVAA